MIIFTLIPPSIAGPQGTPFPCSRNGSFVPSSSSPSPGPGHGFVSNFCQVQTSRAGEVVIIFFGIWFLICGVAIFSNFPLNFFLLFRQFGACKIWFFWFMTGSFIFKKLEDGGQKYYNIGFDLVHGRRVNFNLVQVSSILIQNIIPISATTTCANRSTPPAGPSKNDK